MCAFSSRKLFTALCVFALYPCLPSQQSVVLPSAGDQAEWVPLVPPVQLQVLCRPPVACGIDWGINSAEKQQQWQHFLCTQENRLCFTQHSHCRVFWNTVIWAALSVHTVSGAIRTGELTCYLVAFTEIYCSASKSSVLLLNAYEGSHS